MTNNSRHVVDWCDQVERVVQNTRLIDDLIWHSLIMYALGNLLNYFVRRRRQHLTVLNGIFVLSDKYNCSYQDLF